MTKRWLIPLVGAALAACAGPKLPTTARGEVVLTIRGQVKHGPFILQRSDLAGLPRAGFRAVDPATGREARFDGVALVPFLARKLEAVDGGDTILVVAADGVTLPTPAGLLRQYRPILADQVDGRPAPLQLAWPNLDQPGLGADPRAGLWWLRPVVALELVAWERSWGRALRPPPGLGEEARLGAGHFLLRCAACHRLHGAGGERGPALDGAVGRLGEARFVRWAQEHAGLPEQVGSAMQPREAVSAQVAAFVAASALAGPLDLDEPVTPPQKPKDRTQPAGR